METIFLTQVDIASLLKISKAQVDCLLANDEFPFTRYHRRVIVKLDDLIRFLVKSSTTNRYLDSQDEDPLFVRVKKSTRPSGITNV